MKAFENLPQWEAINKHVNWKAAHDGPNGCCRKEGRTLKRWKLALAYSHRVVSIWMMQEMVWIHFSLDLLRFWEWCGHFVSKLWLDSAGSMQIMVKLRSMELEKISIKQIVDSNRIRWRTWHFKSFFIGGNDFCCWDAHCSGCSFTIWWLLWMNVSIFWVLSWPKVCLNVKPQNCDKITDVV